MLGETERFFRSVCEESWTVENEGHIGPWARPTVPFGQNMLAMPKSVRCVLWYPESFISSSWCLALCSAPQLSLCSHL